MSHQILVASWNVNNLKGIELANTSWLHDLLARECDIVVFGFQECELNLKGLITGGSKKTREAWEQALLNRIEQASWGSSRYVHLVSEHMVGLLIIVFVKISLAAQISDVESSKVATGLASRVGNKGGVSVRFSLSPRSAPDQSSLSSSSTSPKMWFCFTNAHLAAHQEKFDRRERDAVEILTSSRFAHPISTIQNHHFSWFFGDLNYRLNLSATQIHTLLPEISNQENPLLNYDQLHQSTSLSGYQEGHIGFPPTFKVKIGTSHYHPQRIPAYCDRILFSSDSPTHLLTQLEYSRSEVLLSDHLPVYSIFELSSQILPQMPPLPSFWQKCLRVLCCRIC